MEYIKPAKLNPGDTVAILSPSWGGPSRFPAIYDRGLDVLRTVFNLHIKEYPTARADADTIYAHPQARAADVNAAFADPRLRPSFRVLVAMTRCAFCRSWTKPQSSPNPKSCSASQIRRRCWPTLARYPTRVMAKRV